MDTQSPAFHSSEGTSPSVGESSAPRASSFGDDTLLSQVVPQRNAAKKAISALKEPSLRNTKGTFPTPTNGGKISIPTVRRYGGKRKGSQRSKVSSPVFESEDEREERRVPPARRQSAGNVRVTRTPAKPPISRSASASTLRQRALTQPQRASSSRTAAAVAKKQLLRTPSPTSSSSLSPAPSSPVSPPRSPAKRTRVSEPSPDITASPSKRLRTQTTNSQSSLPSSSAPAKKDLPSFKAPVSSARSMIRSSSSKTLGFGSDMEEVWDIKSLGSIVWVGLTSDGSVLQGELKTAEEGSVYWWPAQVTKNTTFPAPSLSLSLFGEVGNGRGRSLTVDNPNAINVLSFRSPQTSTVRFRMTNYSNIDDLRPSTDSSLPPSSSAPSSDSQSKEKKELDIRWNKALQKALEFDQEDNDDLPDPMFLGNTPAKSGAGKGKESKKVEDDDDWESDDKMDLDIVEDNWEDPGPDDSLTIPGEPVFARTKKTATYYYPAKVQLYKPAQKHNRNRRGKYRVHFFDGVEMDVERDLFYAAHQEEFLTCNVGEMVMNDEEESDSAESRRSTPSRRLNTPPAETSPPTYPPPSPDDFEDLPLDQQLSYVYPVLARIIDDSYAPARWRSDAFIAGGASRHDLYRSARSGPLSDGEVSKISRSVRRWALGVERWAERMEEEHVEAPKDAVSPLIDEDRQPAEEHRGASKDVAPEAPPLVEVARQSTPPPILEPDDSTAIDALLALQASPEPPARRIIHSPSLQGEGFFKSLHSPAMGPSGVITPAQLESHNEIEKKFGVKLETISFCTPQPEKSSSQPAPELRSQAVEKEFGVQLETATYCTPNNTSEAISQPLTRLGTHGAVEKDFGVTLEGGTFCTLSKAEQGDEVMRQAYPLKEPGPSGQIPEQKLGADVRQPRPQGSSDYEKLSRLERSQYCSDVLQPEAILHLLGFREGVLKRDLSLPSPSAEEESLYKASSELLNKQPTSQWIYDIMRTRDSMLERGKRVRGGRKELTTGRKKVDDFIGGTRSRPKFGRGR